MVAWEADGVEEWEGADAAWGVADSAAAWEAGLVRVDLVEGEWQAADSIVAAGWGEEVLAAWKIEDWPVAVSAAVDLIEEGWEASAETD